MALLHWACDRGHTDIVRLLISCQADVNVVDADGQTPLHYACSCGYANVVKILLENKADLKIKDNDGETASELAEDAAVQMMLSSWKSSGDGV